MKHAYLIMAHNQIPLLKLLIKKLDYKNNDIYVHLDKKCKYKTTELLCVAELAHVYLINRINVSWGGYSQIQCELNLLKQAIKEHHDYYHLITGVDLPIKEHDQIDDFFESKKGMEFVTFDEHAIKTQNFVDRYDKWHFFKRRPNNKVITKIGYFVLNCTLKICEKILNIFSGKRSKKFGNITMMKGSSYFDITHNCAKMIVDKESDIRRMFRFTACCDEVFLHTFVYNSPFKNKLSTIETRFIDWSKHGASPEILTMQHYDDIVKSECLFARKFSINQSKQLIKKLFDDVVL